jgi:hypothetical protein
MSADGSFLETPGLDPDQAEIDLINRTPSPYQFTDRRDVETGQTVAGLSLLLSRPLTQEERDTLKAQVIALGDAIEAGLIVDLKIGKGFKAHRDFPNRNWRFLLRGHLRTDEAPQATPPPAP